MSVFFCEYALESCAPLNPAVERTAHRGALLRGGDGFGCLHPWPELGDAPLAAQLGALRDGGETPLVERARACIAADGAARRGGKSLFDGLVVPPSHYSLPAWETEVPAGFTAVKVKLGSGASSRMNAVAAANPGLRLRGDFNGTSDPASFVRWAGELSDDARARLDFVEDPFPFDPVDWALVEGQTGVALALDRKPVRARWPLRVCKPALEDPSAEAVGRRVVTSSMDHPLGQVFAAWCAAADTGLATEVHGLVTHHLFVPDAFSEALGPPSPVLQVPAGPGLGFGELLESLPWKKLS